MSADTPQSFANHAKMVPGYHYATGLFVLVYLGWSAVRAATLRDWESHFDLVGACGLFGVYAYTRLFPLKAQDRVIRLEEQLRLTRVLPADLAARVPEITPRQLIALRFASDAELPALVRDVLGGTLTEPKAIKQRITNWRADHFRL
jgi:hypothetical protein